ncbi:unnamed protein product, partial [marine sediment metagenome]
MITLETFTEKFRKMVTLCSFPQAMLNPKQVETYFNELRQV